MSEAAGWIVRSTAGRDKGGVFCALGREGEYLLLADGKHRRVRAPKRKKRRHVEALTGPACPYDHPTIRKLKEGAPVTDRELSRLLAAFKEENTLG